MGLFSDITQLAKSRTTYDVGLLQARGYRTLKQLTAQVLQSDGLTTIEWAMLGVLSHHPKGIRSSEVADTLGVQPPLVSRLIAKSEASNWILVAQGEDKREKVLRLSEKGKEGVVRIEKGLRKSVAPLLKGVGARDLLGYLRVLHTISENGKNLPHVSFEEYLPD